MSIGPGARSQGNAVITPGSAVLAQSNGVSIGPGARSQGNAVITPGSAVLAQSNGVSIGPGARSQGNAVITPGSASAQRDCILSRSVGTGPNRSRLIAGRLGPIAYSCARIGGFRSRSDAGALIRYIGIVSQSHAVLSIHGSIGTDGCRIADTDVSAADGRSIRNRLITISPYVRTLADSRHILTPGIGTANGRSITSLGRSPIAQGRGMVS